MRKRAILLTVALSTALGACNMAPHYVRPALPVPEAMPVPETVSEAPAEPGPAQTPAADLAWEHFFTEPKLQGVIRLALDNNRDLRVALANVEQARALYRVQRAEAFPALDAHGSATYQDSPAGMSANPATPGGRSDSYTASIGISAWEIDLFGRVRNLNEAARQQYFASAENRNASETALIAEVATAWLTVAADHDGLRIARDIERAFGETLARVKARFDKGIASELDVRQAQTSYDQARSDVAEGITRLDQARNALNLLAGTIVPADRLPDSLPASGATLPRLPGNLPSEILYRRPDIAAAEHQLRAANANIGVARAAFFPRISLTAALGTISSGLSNLFGKGSDYWSVTPEASLSIFDFGRNQGNLRYSKASRNAMLASYEKAIQTGFREVADALSRRGTIDTQLDAQISLRDGAAAAYRLSEARFRSGIDPFLNTLAAQRTLHGAEQSLLSTRLAKETNAVALYRAFGGDVSLLIPNRESTPNPDRIHLDNKQQSQK